MIDFDKILYPELRDVFMELHQNKPDIQGLIVRGYSKLRAATYLLFQIDDHDLAKNYFSILLQQYITTADAPPKDNTGNDPKTAVQLAFTSTGLKALKLNSAVLDTFSREFIEGMTYADGKTGISERSTLLGDLNSSDPAKWKWGHGDMHVDVSIMLFAENNVALNQLKADVMKLASGLKPIHTADTFEVEPDSVFKEHFGFRDGISQPIIEGFNKSNRPDYDRQQFIAAGEVVLGYQNEYGRFSPSPYVEKDDGSFEYAALPVIDGKKDLGRNGTYMVFRQMEQHVERFWKFMLDRSIEDVVSGGDKAIKLAAKMVGRWPNGTPLVENDKKDEPVDDDTMNNFTYAKEDGFGVKCPYGAHIRRTNPRDQVHAGRLEKESLQMSKRHRMLRRGRIYGAPLEDFNIHKMIERVKDLQKEDESVWIGDPVRGLHFICLVSDLARQFEFVQNVWANTATFGNLCNEVDPIISPRPTVSQPDCHEFTAPKEKMRNRYTNVPEFTTVVGGAYFFLPGIKALKYIIKP